MLCNWLNSSLHPVGTILYPEFLGTLDSEVNILITICLKLGHIAALLKNTEQAVNFYKEGLQTSPNNIELLVTLANLYMQMSYLELCQQTCSTVLRIDPDNETASVMMADIAFRKVSISCYCQVFFIYSVSYN